MPYAMYQFGSVLLPDRIPEDSLNTGDVESTLVDTAGGGIFDHYGSRRRLPRRIQIPHQGRYYGELTYRVLHDDPMFDFVVFRATGDGQQRRITGDGAAMLASQVDAIRAKLGQLDQLWRRRDHDGVLQWKLARLMRINGTNEIANVGKVVDLDLLFETRQAAWRAATITTTSLGSGSGLRSLNVANAGMVTVQDAAIAITAAATITSIRVQTTGVDWTWTGSLTSGQVLTVDAGSQTVRIGSTNAYSGLLLNAGHTARGWLPLAVGMNTVLVTLNNTGSVAIQHYNQWI